MGLEPVGIVDTRRLFRPVGANFAAQLHALPEDAWNRQAVGGWRVRDVVAHLVDGALRRVSFQRDGHRPPPPRTPVTSERELTAFVNDLNAQWIDVARRFSTRVLTDMYVSASTQWADFVETVPLDAPALFPVSWAGDADYASQGWFDIGREFTEVMHHQAQVRQAVGVSFDCLDASRAFIAIAVLGLPHAFRAVRRGEGSTLTIVITGDEGGTWTLRRDRDRWSIWVGDVPDPTARAVMSAEDASRLLFNALPSPAAAQAISVDGDSELAAAVVRARSVIV